MSKDQLGGASCANRLALRMEGDIRRSIRAIATIAVLILTLLFSSTQSGLAQQAKHIVVTLNKSRTVPIDRVFASAVVGSTDIADVLPMSDRSIYIQGKKIGTTNVSVFDQSMRLITVFDLEVAIDAANLESKIRAGTGSAGIRVSSSNGQIVLSGIANSAVAADRAVSLAKAMASGGNDTGGQGGNTAPTSNANVQIGGSGGGQGTPSGPVIINTMQVAAAQQVMLRVRFLEASRDAGRELGVNWFVANRAGNRGITTGLGAPNPTNPSRPPTSGVDGTGAPVSGAGIPVFQTAGTLLGTTSQPFGVALASLARNGTSVDVLISALETKGLVRRLAEPDLVALSGDTAAFLAGGEFPIPVVQSGAVAGGIAPITVEFKPFGVQLTFMPTVLANGIINLRLAPSVSELDFANAVTISGFNIPSLVKREARTTIELRDGQSFAIAGLLSTEGRRNVSQLPWIGSVPVLGALFRSASFQQQETDLVVIVTPHLVAPAAPGQRVASPFDDQLPTNDVDFFLAGQMEQRKKYNDYVTTGGGINGPYGHMIRAEDYVSPQK
jgi:pilus assembly protein CpaC